MLLKLYNALFNRIFTLLLRLLFCFKGIKCGSNLFVMNCFPRLSIRRGYKEIYIGNNFTINGYSMDTAWYCKTAITVCRNSILKIGNFVGINGVMIYCSKEISIGDYVCIGGGTKIFDTDFHSTDWRVRRDKKRFTESFSSPITIENDVFIGTNCTICKGVHIGEKAIIGAGSVVVKDIPANCVAVGNPCQVIKYINQ